mmetsp:Transcript_95412/g.270072  ORF Transcript_95412/g.270072 Transcript_95412/m.270072 type:complete len:368 (+) Transcript_95412:748-1851(+)
MRRAGHEEVEPAGRRAGDDEGELPRRPAALREQHQRPLVVDHVEPLRERALQAHHACPADVDGVQAHLVHEGDAAADAEADGAEVDGARDLAGRDPRDPAVGRDEERHEVRAEGRVPAEAVGLPADRGELERAPGSHVHRQARDAHVPAGRGVVLPGAGARDEPLAEDEVPPDAVAPQRLPGGPAPGLEADEVGRGALEGLAAHAHGEGVDVGPDAPGHLAALRVLAELDRPPLVGRHHQVRLRRRVPADDRGGQHRGVRVAVRLPRGRPGRRRRRPLGPARRGGGPGHGRPCEVQAPGGHAGHPRRPALDPWRPRRQQPHVSGRAREGASRAEVARRTSAQPSAWWDGPAPVWGRRTGGKGRRAGA